MPEMQTDLSFPVPYGEQAKFLTLADKFLALEGEQDSDVIPIDEDQLLPSGKIKRTA